MPLYAYLMFQEGEVLRWGAFFQPFWTLEEEVKDARRESVKLLRKD